MEKNKFDKFLSRVWILAVAVCIVSIFRIVLHYGLQILHSPEPEGYWNRIFPTLVAAFVISLFLALCCLVVRHIRK